MVEKQCREEIYLVKKKGKSLTTHQSCMGNQKSCDEKAETDPIPIGESVVSKTMQ